MKFVEVVKNYGDIVRAGHIMNGGYHEGMDATRTAALHALGEPGNLSETRERGEVSVSDLRVRMAGDLRYQRKLHEASKLIFRALTGSKRDRLNFEEALSTSDFPKLFGDVIDRAVLANYLETPYTWDKIAYAGEVSDFRPVKRFRIDGGTGLLANTSLNPTGTNAGFDSSKNMLPITQGSPYPESNLQDGQYTYSLAKYGSRMPFTWETLVDDDLNAIKDTPARFGRGARRSEEYFVTKLYANNTSFFSTGNKNVVTNAVVGDSGGDNPILNITGLQRALIVMMQQLDTTGQPISVEAVTLVVPPSLKVVAMNILSSDYVWMADQGGTQQINGANLSATVAQQLHAQNWAKNIVRIAVNYYLPIVDATHGKTGWYLFSNPENGRPALEFGRLRGHIQPELFMKLPNSVAIGEGSFGPGAGVMPGTTNMNPLEGDFDTDSINYKIRHVFGGTTIDPIQAVYSNGSGS